MKRWFAILLTAALLCSCVSALADDIAVVRDSITVGSMSHMTGFFFSDLWSNNTADVDVRALLHGQNTISWTYNGEYAVDTSVLADTQVALAGNGNKTYTFTLAEGLKFSDGSPITAYDYAFSVLLLSSPLFAELGVRNDSYSHLQGGAEYASGEADVFRGLRVYDEKTFSLTILGEMLPYYYELVYVDVTPYPISVLLPGCEVKDDGRGAYISGEATADILRETIFAPETGYMTHPQVVSGPYTLVSYDEDARVAEFERNDYYPGNFEGQKPVIRHITYKPITDSEMLDALESGEFDIINKVTNGDAITDGLARVAEDRMSASNYLRSGLGFVSFACEQEPCSSVALRQAIAMCIDSATLCAEYLQGYGLPVYGYYGYGQWMVTMSTEELETLNVYGLNLNAARFLLIDEGWTLNETGDIYVAERDAVRYKSVDGVLVPLSLNLAISENSSAAQYLVEMLRENMSEIGAELVMTEMPYAELLEHYYRKTDRVYDMFFLATNFAHVFDPVYIYNVDDVYQGVTNTTGLRDERLQQLAEDMRETESDDTEGYLEKWMNFQERWVELVPCVPLYSNVYFDFFTKDLYEYLPNTHWSWASSILYATFEEPEEEFIEGTEGLEGIEESGDVTEIEIID